MDLSAKLTGDLSTGLEKLEREVQERVLFSGVAAMAQVLYDEAKGRVPVQTGTLRESIYRAYSPELSKEASKVYRISWNRTKAPHGGLIEFGTSRMAARPFIRPSFDHVGEAIKAGQDAMKAKLETI